MIHFLVSVSMLALFILIVDGIVPSSPLHKGAVLGLKWLFGATDTHTPMEQIHFLERIQHTVFKEIGEVPEILFAPEFPVGCRKLNLMVRCMAGGTSRIQA